MNSYHKQTCHFSEKEPFRWLAWQELKKQIKTQKKEKEIFTDKDCLTFQRWCLPVSVRQDLETHISENFSAPPSISYLLPDTLLVEVEVTSMKVNRVFPNSLGYDRSLNLQDMKRHQSQTNKKQQKQSPGAREWIILAGCKPCRRLSSSGTTYAWGLKGNLASLGDKYSCFIFSSGIFPVLENTQQKPHNETHGFFHISGNFGAYPKIIKYFIKIINKIKCTDLPCSIKW